MRKFIMAAVGGTLAGVILTTQVAAPLLAQEAEKTVNVYEQLDLFGDIFERIRAQYVEEVDEGDLIEAAINGMLTSLDPHSSYLPPQDFDDMQVQARGEFGGLGIEVRIDHSRRPDERRLVFLGLAGGLDEVGDENRQFPGSAAVERIRKAELGGGQIRHDEAQRPVDEAVIVGRQGERAEVPGNCHVARGNTRPALDGPELDRLGRGRNDETHTLSRVTVRRETRRIENGVGSRTVRQLTHRFKRSHPVRLDTFLAVPENDPLTVFEEKRWFQCTYDR